MCHGQDLPQALISIHKYIRALHCPTRWEIIQCIGTGERSTREIFEQLELGEEMSLAGLYYHLEMK